MAHAAPDRDAVLSALRRLLEWSEIARSPQLGRFLGYIVQRRLDGQEQAIKAYSIAVDVFGRPPNFDPQVDPIVRVQARRLRGLLEEYYTGPGIDDPVRISLPVGRYVPDFALTDIAPEIEAAGDEPQPGSETSRTRWRIGVWLLLGALAIVLVVALYLFLANNRDGNPPSGISALIDEPSITLVEFQNLAGDAVAGPHAAGLTVELVTDLEQFETIQVGYRTSGDEAAGPAVPAPNHFVFTGIVRLDADLVQYSGILTETRSNQVVWNQTLSIPAAQATAPDILDRVSRSFSLVLGSPRGPLHAPARELLAGLSGDDWEANLYMCRILFDRFRETGGMVEGSKASACFGRLPEASKQDPIALAARASLLVEIGDPAVAVPLAQADRLASAAASLTRALELSPTSSFVWEQQARLHEAQAFIVQARADYASAVQLNPANADAVAAFARLQALGGGLAEAKAMAQEVAEKSPEPPAWYFGVPTLAALRDRNFDQALEWAQLYARADRELGPILAIMAAQGAGDSAVVNRYLPEILDLPAFHAKGVLPRVRERVTDDSLVEAMRQSLTEAGVPWAALTRPF